MNEVTRAMQIKERIMGRLLDPDYKLCNSVSNTSHLREGTPLNERLVVALETIALAGNW